MTTSFLPILMAPHTKNLDRIITEIDVDDILKTLDTSKATGPDMLNLRLLKEASSILQYPLCTLFNLSLSTSNFLLSGNLQM